MVSPLSIARFARFWLKTALYASTPGGYGYYRGLRRYRDPVYVHSRDRHPVRAKHYAGEGWDAHERAGIRRRDYESYEEYLVHQRQKFDEILKVQGGFRNRDVVVWRMRFYRRFRHLVGLVPPSGVIVCAGARQGTEVEVLRDLGFRNAYGVDLNPGASNPLVRQGDFHRLDNPTSSVDVVYSNSLDHAYDLATFFREHARILKPGGYVLYDVSTGRPENRSTFESLLWREKDAVLREMLPHFDRVVRSESESGWTWILLQAKPNGAYAAPESEAGAVETRDEPASRP